MLTLGVTKVQLGVIPSGKGLMCGKIRLLMDDGEVLDGVKVTNVNEHWRS